jgi:hypothetical protein
MWLTQIISIDNVYDDVTMLIYHSRQCQILVRYRLVQPLEGTISLTPIGQHIGDIIGRYLFILLNQIRPCGIGFIRPAQRLGLFKDSSGSRRQKGDS